MGDIGAEPSMEEILSSIKRIIAEEGDGPAARRRVPSRPAPAALPEPHAFSAPSEDAREEEGVLELSDPMPLAGPEAEPDVSSQAADVPPEPVPPAPSPAPVAAPGPVPSPAVADPILSPAAADATRGALASLSKLMVKPEPPSDGTLEGLVRDMLRPILREWLDANLPDMVEAMVAKEIARISGQGR